MVVFCCFLLSSFDNFGSRVSDIQFASDDQTVSERLGPSETHGQSDDQTETREDAWVDQAGVTGWVVGGVVGDVVGGVVGGECGRFGWRCGWCYG